jgi:hypothetical protein
VVIDDGRNSDTLGGEMFIAIFDSKNPKDGVVTEFETIEAGYADLSTRFKKKCPKFDNIIVGKEFDLEGKTYCFFEDDAMARDWLTVQRYAIKK